MEFMKPHLIKYKSFVIVEYSSYYFLILLKFLSYHLIYICYV